MIRTSIKAILAVSLFLTSCSRPQIPFFESSTPVYKKLPNGLEIFLLEDHELPTVQLTLFIRGGSVYDPPGQEGLSSVAMQTIRLGGIGRRTKANGGGFLTPNSIDDALEFVGASLEMGTSPEHFSSSLSLLKKDMDLGLDLLFQLLKEPALDPGKFDLVKERTREAILREREDPLTLATREFPPFIYGKESRWGRKPTLESIDRIRREDVVKFHRDFIRPDRILLAAAGDFRTAEFLSEIEERVGDWKVSSEPLPPLPPTEEKFRRQTLVLAKPGLTQTTLFLGHLGGKRGNPDKFPLLVMDFILGGSGSLTSRLGEEVREKEGKAYAIWSDFGFAKDFGLFRVVAQTSLENTGSVLQKIEAMIQETATDPRFTSREISRAKQAILRSLFFDFETRFSQVVGQARFHLWGYPENYLQIYQEEISRVTRRDLERVAGKYLHPEGLQILLVTDETKADLTFLEKAEKRSE